MDARRPYGSREAALVTSDECCRALGTQDWIEAFAHHPRIGERTSAVAQGEQGMAWSAREQSGIEAGGHELRAALADANRAYERRFGYIYIVCATGKSAEELLAIARGRLANDPAIELAIAAEEQRKIARIRLDKLLGHEEKA